MANMNSYTGGALRIGSFLEMMQELLRLITEMTPAALKLDAEAPQFAAKVAQLEVLVKRLRAFEETKAVSTMDASRDALWLACYYMHHYLKALPETHPLTEYVTRLTPVMNTYKNLQRSELMEQTAETRGFLAEMAKPANAEAAEQIGMSQLLPYLQTANEATTEANAARTTSAAHRQAELGDESSDEVRKQLVTLYRTIADRVNAANIFYPSEAITAFIQRANAIADHYRLIAGKKGAASDSEDENGGAAGGNTSTSTDPADNQGGSQGQGGQGNSDNTGNTDSPGNTGSTDNPGTTDNPTNPGGGGNDDPDNGME